MVEKISMYKSLTINLSLLVLVIGVCTLLNRVVIPALSRWLKKHYVYKGLPPEMMQMCVCGCEYFKHDDDGECAYCDNCAKFVKFEEDMKYVVNYRIECSGTVEVEAESEEAARSKVSGMPASELARESDSCDVEIVNE